ncbi:MAG: hypothetical protein QM813_12305 [Verrucomicrobiota bacterium]
MVHLAGVERFAHNPYVALTTNFKQMILGHLKVVSGQINSRFQKFRDSQRKNLALPGDSIAGARAAKLASLCQVILVFRGATGVKPMRVNGWINQSIPNPCYGLVDLDFS